MKDFPFFFSSKQDLDFVRELGLKKPQQFLKGEMLH